MPVELKVEKYALLDMDRLMIDRLENIHPAYYRFVQQQTYAESWLDAKERLGFELSPEQQVLRAKQLEQEHDSQDA